MRTRSRARQSVRSRRGPGVVQTKRAPAAVADAHELPPPSIAAQAKAGLRGHSLSTIGMGAAPVQRFADSAAPAFAPAPAAPALADSVAPASLESVAEQPAPNRTGLPDTLKAGVEALSGLALDDVRVHYRSSKPGALGALAYAQGTDIHVAPGQEQHLPHEAWHVVQQIQGRVSSDGQRGGVPLNTDSALEGEAERMAERLRWMGDRQSPEAELGQGAVGQGVAQLFIEPPAEPPTSGQRSDKSSEDGRPLEISITTVQGNTNDLEGSTPSEDILGWEYLKDITALTKDKWVRFHLINHNNGGEGIQKNMVPTSNKTNLGSEWLNFEKKCKSYIAGQLSVHITAQVEYHAELPDAETGSLQANQHYFPTKISAQCFIWDSEKKTYILADNVDVIPDPLLPPDKSEVDSIIRQKVENGLDDLKNSSEAGTSPEKLEKSIARNKHFMDSIADTYFEEIDALDDELS